MFTLYHNPECGMSRSVLSILRESGKELRVREYVLEPLSAEELQRLVRKTGTSARELLRTKEALYEELGLDNPDVSDDQIIAAIEKHPVLLNRPFVETEQTALLCRPADTVHSLL